MLRTRLLLTWAGVVFIVVVIVFPVYWGIRTSLVSGYDLTLFPTELTVEHYYFLFRSGHFINNIKNSLIVSLGALFATLPVALLAGYSLARFNFPGKRYSAILLVLPLLPAIAVLVPLILYMRGLGLYNTLYSVILATTVFILPYTTWMIRGFMLAIPMEIEEAAQLDGCGPMPRAVAHCHTPRCARPDRLRDFHPDFGLEQLSVLLRVYYKGRSAGGSSRSARFHHGMGYRLRWHERRRNSRHAAASYFLSNFPEVVRARHVGWGHEIDSWRI